MTNPFSKALLRAQMRRQGQEVGRTSLPPMQADWRGNLYPSLVPEAERLINEGLPRHSHLEARNSSQAFAINLALPAAVGDPAPISAALSALVKMQLTLKSVALEYAGEAGWLAEVSGASFKPKDRYTMADIALFVEDAQGRSGVILIEVKLSEGGFTTCGGVTSRHNKDRAPCEDASVFLSDPSRCYLTRPKFSSRDRRYWALLEGAYGAVRGALSGWEPEGGCPFAGDWQQPMRNHALALAMVDAGQASFWHLALVHHDQNPYVVEPWEAYRLASAASAQLHRWPASTLLTALSEALQDPSYTSWMTSRYVLDEEIKYEL